MAVPRFLRSASSCLPTGLRTPTSTTARNHLLAPLPSSPTPLTTRPFYSSQSPTMASVEHLIKLAEGRRTYYKLGKQSPVPDSKVQELVNAAILNVPSSFNTQSTRLVVLLHADHEKLWDIAIDVFEKKLLATGAIPEEMWKKQTLPKLQGLKNGYGTILFYEDPAHIKAFQEKFPIYKEQFVPWSDHSNGMHQYFLWTGLEALGFGANLQHYNPLIDEPVAKQWGLPIEWKNLGQMVFGSREGAPNEKAQKPVEERVKVFGRL